MDFQSELTSFLLFPFQNKLFQGTVAHFCGNGFAEKWKGRIWTSSLHEFCSIPRKCRDLYLVPRALLKLVRGKLISCAFIGSTVS